MKVFRVAIYVCLAAVIIYIGCRVEVKLNEYRVAQNIKKERVMEVREGRKVDFAKLKKENPDTKGWIMLPDTNIDYPVVQGIDNDYYLHRDFDGSYLYDGCIFIDSSVDRIFSPDVNTVIYGHRMSSGAMFHDLRKYDDKDFFDSHRIIYFETEDKSYDLHVVAICKEMSDSELYTTLFEDDSFYEDFFDDEESEAPSEEVPPSRENSFLSKSEFIEMVREKAVSLSGETFDENDIYVTLSTCVYSTGEERMQVICTLHDAPMVEKEKVVETQKPAVNIWLILQILVGAAMALVVLIPIINAVRR